MKKSVLIITVIALLLVVGVVLVILSVKTHTNYETTYDQSSNTASSDTSPVVKYTESKVSKPNQRDIIIDAPPVPKDNECTRLSCPAGTQFLGSNTQMVYYSCDCDSIPVSQEDSLCLATEQDAVYRSFTKAENCQAPTTPTHSH